jgi:CheY-like chemotaxis protein
MMLEGAGYGWTWRASGREGLRKLREHRPDAIVLDVMMESIAEGYAVNQAIKFQPEFEPYADIPIVMVSSIQETPDERFGRSSEVEMVRPNRYLTKPLDIPGVPGGGSEGDASSLGGDVGGGVDAMVAGGVVAGSPAERERIVVIDDDYAMRLSCHQILTKSGFEVETFEDGSQGLVGVAELKPSWWWWT